MMKFIADLHIHSHYSRATSKKLTPEYLDYYAGLKGIKVVGTGDFTHNGWLDELKEKTEPDGTGLLKIKEQYQKESVFGDNETRFMLTAEISNIYKKGGKVRKVHNLILVPGFEEAEKINQKLIDLGGNLHSDGRPILGLDSHDLLEIVLECGELNYFIPAHIWTPWFSMLGSKSGFDSLNECFEDLSHHIYSIETGLSTDAPMNWLCSFLDNVTLISNSDAHSPERLGRNANVFNTDLSYEAITNALKIGDPNIYMGTIDMFPQEGKYHFDGHRKCNVCWNPKQTLQNNYICPVCKKPVTVGVMNRIVQLSDRENIVERPNRLPFRSIIPLKEILAEITGVGENSKKVENEYQHTLQKLGKEMDILNNIPIDLIEKKTTCVLAEAVRRMRNREVYISEGYDGEYGVVNVFKPGEAKNFEATGNLFFVEKIEPPKRREFIDFNLKGVQTLLNKTKNIKKDGKEKNKDDGKINENFENLNNEQMEAVSFTDGPSLIIAGPGTGKTKTLTAKIAWIIKNKIALPEEMLVITFTNKAAGELKCRLKKLLENNEIAEKITVLTFHAFGLLVLKENYEKFKRDENFVLIDGKVKSEIIKSVFNTNRSQTKKIGEAISKIKNGKQKENNELFKYEERLKSFNAFDLDDLLVKPLELLLNDTKVCDKYRNRYQYVFVDEYQDTNYPQYRLLKKLCPENNSNLCVVGDANQSIYGFRGAEVGYIHEFKKDYPKAKIFHLTRSYRCTQTILSASADVLNNNSEVLKGLDKGIQIYVSEQQTGAAEAEFIVRQIEKQMGGVSFFSIDSNVTNGDKNVNSLSDFAVLCRTHNQFEAIGKALNDHHVPYQEVGTTPFYQKGILGSLVAVIRAFSFDSFERTSTFLKLLGEKISVAKYEDGRKIIREKSFVNFVSWVREQFFNEEVLDKNEWKRFYSLTQKYKNIKEFIEVVTLGNGADTHNPRLEAVTLMTMHASKGLEFECVFIPGCEKGLIPYDLYKMEVDEEEEKRLLYVAMTRAKKILYLTYANSRKINGRIFQLPKSQFIKNIKQKFIKQLKNKPNKKEKKKNNQLSLFDLKSL